MFMLDLDPYSSAGHHHDDGLVTTATTVSNLRNRMNRRIRFSFGSLFSFLGGYYTMIGMLVALIDFKFKNKSLSPLQTHGPFLIVSFASLCIVTTASGIMFYTNNTTLSPAYDIILDIVFWYSLIISPVPLLVVIMISQNLIWVGYTLVFVVFAVVLAFYIKSLKTRRVEAFERV